MLVAADSKIMGGPGIWTPNATIIRAFKNLDTSPLMWNLIGTTLMWSKIDTALMWQQLIIED